MTAARHRRQARAWRDGQFELVLSEQLLAEVERTLDKDYFRARLTSSLVTQFLMMLNRQAIIVPLTATVVGVASHQEDDMVLATAISAESEFLVTGDRQLLRLGSYEGVIIVSPWEVPAILGGL